MSFTNERIGELEKVFNKRTDHLTDQDMLIVREWVEDTQEIFTGLTPRDYYPEPGDRPMFNNQGTLVSEYFYTAFRIKAFRIFCGLTLDKAGEIIGISRQTFSNYEMESFSQGIMKIQRDKLIKESKKILWSQNKVPELAEQLNILIPINEKYMCYFGCDYVWKVVHPVFRTIKCPNCKEEGDSNIFKDMYEANNDELIFTSEPNELSSETNKDSKFMKELNKFFQDTKELDFKTNQKIIEQWLNINNSRVKLSNYDLSKIREKDFEVLRSKLLDLEKETESKINEIKTNLNSIDKLENVILEKVLGKELHEIMSSQHWDVADELLDKNQFPDYLSLLMRAYYRNLILHDLKKFKKDGLTFLPSEEKDNDK